MLHFFLMKASLIRNLWFLYTNTFYMSTHIRDSWHISSTFHPMLELFYCHNLCSSMKNSIRYLTPHLLPILVGLVWIIWWVLLITLQQFSSVKPGNISSQLIFCWHATSLSKNSLSAWILVFEKIANTTSWSAAFSSRFQNFSVRVRLSICASLWTEQNWEKL